METGTQTGDLDQKVNQYNIFKIKQIFKLIIKRIK